MAGDGARPDELPAGEFSAWVGELQAAIRGERDADVPCDGCTACCTSAQFVHIAPDELDTLAHVPRRLLFPAPRLPAGHVVLGYDEQGRCPMLVDGSCSIYDHRPRTCRAYDCRVFAAAGVDVGADGKVDIARRVQRWQFSYATEDDRVRHDAVRAAAAFVRARSGELPEEHRPTNATRLAVLAVEVHDAFLARDDGTNRAQLVDPSPADVMRRLPAREHVEECAPEEHEV